MLYLEDYLELIEHLPQELRDRFTDIREYDLQVQNSTEQLRDKVKLFFADARLQQQQQQQQQLQLSASQQNSSPPTAGGAVINATAAPAAEGAVAGVAPAATAAPTLAAVPVCATASVGPLQLAATKLKQQQDYEQLINEYQGAMKYADDKVHIAEQMHEIMIKLVQRLDTELEKFKLELEADHAGITEELERRSLELDADSCLDDLINNNHNGIIQQQQQQHNGQATQATTTTTSIKVPSGIKDRRRSEHKHRHHPYQNNQDNGYHGRAKLSQHEHNNHTPRGSTHHHNHHQQNGGSKHILHDASGFRQQATSTSPPTQFDLSGYSSLSAPASVAGADTNGTETTGHYGNNLSSFGNNPGFKNSSNKNNLQNLPFSQQHSALSAALASTTPQLNSVSALAMMNSTSVHNKISTNNSLKVNELIDPSSPLVRQNPIAAAASQAIAATQQLQQGRRTPSLKASFAAINAAALGPTDSLGNKHDVTIGNNRNALAPMTPDQQAYTYGQQFGKHNANGTPSPLYVSVTKSGRPTKRPRHHASHLFPDESPTSISSDNSVFENSESLSSTDFIETGTTFGSTSPSSLDFATNGSQGGNTNLYHRDEAKYCVCRQISYGLMIACDNNQECENEWFHYDCVGITQTPKGKWFCPDCTRKMNGHPQHQNPPQTQKKRGRKEKSLFNLVNNSLDSVRAAKDLGV